MNTTIDNARIGFLFDLDGVLIESETEYSRIWTEIDRKFHSGYDDLATRIKGTTLDSIIDTYFPHADRQAEPWISFSLHPIIRFRPCS